MLNPENGIKKKTVDALAKGVYSEASKYGMQKPDILRFVNTLLQLSMEEGEAGDAPSPSSTLTPETASMQDDELSIQACCTQDDRERIKHWLNDTEGQHFLRHRLTAQTISLDQLLDQKQHILGLIMHEGHRPIGCVAFLDYDQTQQKAELRKLIGEPDMRGRGYGKRATRLWINYGLQALGLQKIYLNTLSNNIRNIRINEELGFSVEGILRNEVYIEGKYQDIIRMGLCTGS
ncbi:MAG: GNAT family protein [Bacteroidota bacterium]